MDQDITCVICSSRLVDPRPLPCGHSYCGPQRPCLKSLDNGAGGLRCAICREEHKLKAEKIKPLYGIRDFIQCASTLEEKTTKLYLPCSTHQDKNCTKWCMKCDVMICEDCFGGEHDGHLVRMLKKYLVDKVESKFGKPWSEGLSQYREKLTMVFNSRKIELEELKARLKAVETDVSLVQQQQEAIHKCSKFLSADAEDKSWSETVFLLRLSELQLLNLDSLIYDESPENVSRKLKLWVKSETPIANVKTESKFLFTTLLVVHSWQPLQIGASESFKFGELTLWLQAKLVDKFNQADKMLRIIINCDASNSSVFDLRFKFTLHNMSDEKLTKEKEGMWNFPEYEKLFWHPMTYAELVDPWKHWFVKTPNKYECLLIVLELEEID